MSVSSRKQSIKLEDNDEERGGSLSNKVVVQHKPKDTSSGILCTGDEWPFEGIVEQLCLDLFDPKWEARHGAALGLKELLMSHADGAGKVVGHSISSNTLLHNQVPEPF